MFVFKGVLASLSVLNLSLKQIKKPALFSFKASLHLCFTKSLVHWLNLNSEGFFLFCSQTIGLKLLRHTCKLNEDYFED